MVYYTSCRVRTPTRCTYSFLFDYSDLSILKQFFFYSGNGYITTDVLREILRELDNNITKEELDMMIQEIDSDGSGTVDFDGKIVYS